MFLALFSKEQLKMLVVMYKEGVGVGGCGCLTDKMNLQCISQPFVT